MPLSYYSVLSIIILFQLTLLVLFLLTINRGRKSSNRLLAMFFVLLIINLLDGVLTFYGMYTHFPAFAHLEDGFVFLLGPVIYFYTVSMVYSDFQFSRGNLAHTIPFLVVTIAYQLFYHFQTEQYQRMIQDAIVEQSLPPQFYVIALLIYAHIGIYIFLSFRELGLYRVKIREKFSSVDRINLDWLAYMLWSMVIILVLSLAYTLMPAIGLKEYFRFFFALVFLVMFIFINGIVWKGLRQPEIFAGVESDPQPEKKYKDHLTELERNAIQAALQKAMEQKAYLNPDLSLDNLAESLSYPPRKVSQVMNDDFNQNFFDYINSYRIREAEQRLRDSLDPKLTVLEVMYACGFNSKSSFNTIFKQKTGQTPTAYRTSHRVPS
jgi:AraC-like DNA-binding protein